MKYPANKLKAELLCRKLCRERKKISESLLRVLSEGLEAEVLQRKLRRAAVPLQSAFRRGTAKKELARLRAARDANAAATCIQSLVRSSLVRSKRAKESAKAAAAAVPKNHPASSTGANGGDSNGGEAVTNGSSTGAIPGLVDP